jgi:hypothetical protein
MLKAAKSATTVSTAEPMAKPLPTAAVVLPTESSSSVMSRTSLPEAGHLRDAAGVVGDGAVGVDGHHDGGAGEHADGGEGDAVEAEVVVGHPAHTTQR